MDWDHDYTGNNVIACDTSLTTITDVNDFLNCRAHCEGFTGANYFSLSATGGCCCKRNAQGRNATAGFVSGELRCDTAGKTHCNEVVLHQRQIYCHLTQYHGVMIINAAPIILILLATQRNVIHHPRRRAVAGGGAAVLLNTAHALAALTIGQPVVIA